jgi:hypothetical protein
LKGQSYRNISQVEIQFPVSPLNLKEALKCDVKHTLYNVTRFNGEADRESNRQGLLTADNYTARHHVYMTHADVAQRQGCPTHMFILRYFISTESEFDSLPQQIRIYLH